MKKTKFLISVAFVVITLLAVISAVGFAETSTDGWCLDYDGETRYYVDDDYLTGTQEINGYWYVFDDEGALKGVYDSHTDIGTANVAGSTAYETALKALGGENVLAYYTFDGGETYKSTDYISANQWRVGNMHSSINQNTVSQYIYTKHAAFTSSATQRLLAVQRYATNTIVKRGNGNALEVKSTVTGGHGYIHTYLDANQVIAPNTDVIIDCEFKLGEHFSYGATLYQLIDRDNVDIEAGANIPLLYISENGGVYHGNDSSNFLCVVGKNEFTRISVAIHPSTNTVDVYVNGILVGEALAYIPDSRYKAENFEIEAIRFARFDEVGSGSMLIDNFAVYKSDKPICTTTAQPKNGVYMEGGFLRFYENNLIAYGNRIVNLNIGGEKLEKSVIYFGDITGHGGYALGDVATISVNGAVKSADVVAGNIFVAPDAPILNENKFGGWLIKDGDHTDILAPGEIYIMNGDISCEPYLLDFSMLDGASIRTTSGSSGIRFMAKIKSSKYDELRENGIKIEPHILIVPTSYMDKIYGYNTIEALKTADFEFIDIKSTDWYNVANGYYYFTGSVANILPENYMLDYSGVAYLKVTYPSGAIRYEYADYDKSVNSRSVYRVAHAAYNDRVTSGGNPAYTNGVKYNGASTFSPYNDEKLGIIKEFADRVIMIESDVDKVKVAGDFYDAPYTVSEKFNATTMKTDVTVTSTSGWSVSDAFGVVFNGKKLSDYTVTDKCVFSVVIEGTELSALKQAGHEFSSWTFMDASKDYKVFPKGSLNIDKNYCYEDGIDSAKWRYADGGTTAFKPSSGSSVGSYNAVYDSNDACYYYDLSDFSAISFAIYSVIDDQTLQFNIYSENPETDGIDYYGKKLVLEQGWNYFVIPKWQFSVSRTPIGWGKINNITFIASGWNQTNSSDNIVYITDITAYDNEDPSAPFDRSIFSNAAIFAVGGFYSGINGNKYSASLDDPNSTAFEKNGVYYLPIGGVADAKGMVGKYYSASGVLQASYKGKSYEFTSGSRTYTVDGVKQKLKYAAQESGDALCFSSEDVMSLFGYTQRYIDRMGLIVLSNTKNILDEDRDYTLIYSLMEECVYVRPTGEQIVEDLNEHSGGQHPYLLLNNDEFAKLRYYAKMDPTMQKYIARIESSYGIGTSNFKAEPNTYRLTDGLRLLAISRNVMDKTLCWALLAKLYEESDPATAERYAERCWQEIEAACNFKNPETGRYSWHPEIFLDTSELAYPIAICYDWLYDYWAETDNALDRTKYTYEAGTTRRSLIEDSLYWMALAVTSTLASDTTGKYDICSYNLASMTNNWNGVCNGGMMAAALAICNVERYSDNVKIHLNSNITCIEQGMWVYAPDGGYEEGPGYWTYGTNYTHVFISCLDSACGTNYGVYNAPGFAESVYFSTYMGSKNTVWGYHDGASTSANTDIAAWFAKKSGDPNVNAIRRQALNNKWKNSWIYDILYFDPHLMTETITLGLDAYYSLDPVMTFRSSWSDGDSFMVGLHGGDNAASHGDLDIGNFVINVNGVFMICDLGSEAYNTAGYFGAYRLSYYRKRAEGQNTLVMLPSSENVDGNGWNGKTGIPCITNEKANTAGTTNYPIVDQVRAAISKVLRYESGENGAIGIIDMAPAYAEMTSGRRGLWFTDDRSIAVIQDEATFSTKMDIWWFAHTEGVIKISEDGRSATITRSGIVLYAEIVTNMSADARFTKMKAESLDKNYVGDTTDSDYYGDDVEKSRESYSKLCVTVDDVTELKLAVVFKVLNSEYEDIELGTTYAWKDMDSWVVD